MAKFFNAWDNPPVDKGEITTLPSDTEPGLVQSVDDLVKQCLRTGFIPQPEADEYDCQEGDDFQELPEEFDNLLDLELVDYSSIVDAGIAAYQNLVAEGKINKDGTRVHDTKATSSGTAKKPSGEDVEVATDSSHPEDLEEE
uniref:Uncharacterized protein n=1 Tax=Dulem virus 95 TaxID=3145806 RepID=A0AAU8AXV3_9VIRU